MPAPLLRETIQGVDLLNWPNLYRLRNLFQVTITALTVRLTRLNLLDVVRLTSNCIHHARSMTAKCGWLFDRKQSDAD